MPNITDLLPNTLPADYATQQNDVDRTVDVPVQIVPDIQVGHVHVFTSTQTSRDDALDDFYVNGRPTTGTLFTVGDTAVITFNAGTTIETLLYTNSTSKSGATVASDWIDITEAVGAVNLDATHNASNVVITNTAGNDATINGATLSAAGVVTTGTQAFAGNKRFSGSTITVSNQLEVDGNTVLGSDNTAIIQLWGSVGVPTSAGTATTTTNMLTVDGDGTVEIRNLPTSTGSGGGEVVILTATGQTVPDNGVAYVSLTEQYWNISGADQTNVVLTTDFTDTNTWARVGDGGGTVNLGVNPGTADVEITNTGGANATITGANTTQAGVVTTGIQSFAGVKSFVSDVAVAGNFTAAGNVNLGDAVTDVIQLWGAVDNPSSSGVATTGTTGTEMLSVDADGTLQIVTLPVSISGDDISINGVDISNANFVDDTTSTATTRGVTFAVTNTNEVRGTVDVSGIAGDDISVNSVDITNPNFLNDTTSTSTTRGVTFAVTNTNEIRGTVDVSGLDEEAVVILTTTGQDVPPNGVAYVSSTEQYWNVSGSGQTGVTTTTDFTAQDTWRRIVDITNLENQVQDLENHPKGITRIEDATDYPRASTVSYGADYWNATRRSEIQTLDFGVRFLVGSRHLLVNNNNVNFTGLSVGDVLSVRTGFVDSDNPGTEIARFRVGSVQGRAARFDALDDATVTFLFNNRDTANSDSSTYFFTASQRNTIFAGWHEETASHPTDVLLTRQADNTVGTRSIGGTDPNNIATLSDAISPTVSDGTNEVANPSSINLSVGAPGEDLLVSGTDNGPANVRLPATGTDTTNPPSDFRITGQSVTVSSTTTSATFTFPANHIWRTGMVGFAKSDLDDTAFNFTVTTVATNNVTVSIDDIFRQDGNAHGAWEIATGHRNIDTTGSVTRTGTQATGDSTTPAPSTGALDFWSGTQAQYDALVAAGETDPNTLYLTTT